MRQMEKRDGLLGSHPNTIDVSNIILLKQEVKEILTQLIFPQLVLVK